MKLSTGYIKFAIERSVPCLMFGGIERYLSRPRRWSFTLYIHLTGLTEDTVDKLVLKMVPTDKCILKELEKVVEKALAETVGERELCRSLDSYVIARVLL